MDLLSLDLKSVSIRVHEATEAEAKPILCRISRESEIVRKIGIRILHLPRDLKAVIQEGIFDSPNRGIEI